MNRVEVLWNPLTKPELPQCETDRLNDYYNDKPDTDRRCKHGARYKIDGKCFCARHAGIYALQTLMKEGGVKPVIPTPPTVEYNYSKQNRLPKRWYFPFSRD